MIDPAPETTGSETIGSALGRLGRVMALTALVGTAPAVAGCADIHPEPNDPGGGLLGSPTGQGEEMRQQREREEQREREGQVDR